MTFSESVLLTAVSFDNDGHNRITNGHIGYSKGGSLNFLQLDITESVNDYSDLGASTVWSFAKVSNGENFDFNTMTVSSVPVPAVLPLLLAGLGGLGWIGRRRKSA